MVNARIAFYCEILIRRSRAIVSAKLVRGFKSYLSRVTPDRTAIFLTVRNVRAGFMVTLFRATTRAMRLFMRYGTGERNDEEIGGTAGIKV